MRAFVLAVVFSGVIGRSEDDAEGIHKAPLLLVSVEQIKMAQKLAREPVPLLRQPSGRA